MPKKHQLPDYDITPLEGETFVVVQGFENYTISNFGRIISYAQKKPKLLRPQTDAMGYLHYRLYNRTETDELNVQLFKGHRLVGMYFLPKPKEEPGIPLEINHRDGNKSNNHFSNLEWITRSENLKHAIRTGLKRTFPANAMNRKPVEVFKRGESLGEYDTILDAAVDLGLNVQSITLWLKGKVRSRKGYSVKYLPKEGSYKRVVTKRPTHPKSAPQLN